MSFFITDNVAPVHVSALRQASRRVGHWLRHFDAALEMSPQQRADRYVAQLPTAVLGAR